MEDDTSSPSPSLPPLLLPPLLSERVADSQEEAIGDVPLHSDTTNHESLIVSTEPTMETRYPRSVSVGVDDWTLEKRQVPEDTIFSRWSHRRSSLPCSPLDGLFSAFLSFFCVCACVCVCVRVSEAPLCLSSVFVHERARPEKGKSPRKKKKKKKKKTPRLFRDSAVLLM